MQEKETRGSVKPTRSIIFVALLWVLQSAGRIVLGYLSAITPEGLLDVEATQATIQIINAVFLLLGILGFIAVAGLLTMKKWGFWAMVSVSVLTILFGIWGATVQFSAVMGFVVPVISLLVLCQKT